MSYQNATQGSGVINEYTAKLLVGLIALSLAGFTNFLTGGQVLNSISQSYHEGGWARDIFVGFLFAIFAFLLSFNGHSSLEKILSRVAAFAAIFVALFPCECDGYGQIIPGLHGLSATVMFAILAIFCVIFLKRAWRKGYRQARIRACIYGICSLTIILAMIVIGIDEFTGGSISADVPRLVFYGERAGLIAFGVAWLTASKCFPVITKDSERNTFFRNPETQATDGDNNIEHD